MLTYKRVLDQYELSEGMNADLATQFFQVQKQFFQLRFNLFFVAC